MPTQDAIDQAYTNLFLAGKKLSNTQEDVADLEWKLTNIHSGTPPDAYSKNHRKKFRTSFKGLEIQLTQNQLAYNRAETNYNDF